MFKVAFLQFPDHTACAPRSGWYITAEDGAIVARAGRFEHRACAVRAVMALLNAPAFV